MEAVLVQRKGPQKHLLKLSLGLTKISRINNIKKLCFIFTQTFGKLDHTIITIKYSHYSIRPTKGGSEYGFK